MLAEQVSLPELRAAIDVVTELVNPDGSEGSNAAEMMRRFTTVRSFLPALASAKPFGATAGGAPTLAALGALPDFLDGRKTDPSQVDLSLVPPAWQRLIEGAGGIDSRAYTVAVIDAVHKALRRRDIFHGRRGQIRQFYREGQEDQLGALDIVLNAVILWNTRYLDAALTELRGRSFGPSETPTRPQRLDRSNLALNVTRPVWGTRRVHTDIHEDVAWCSSHSCVVTRCGKTVSS
jgi:hypothetical protein